MSRIAVFLNRFFYKVWFFGACYYWGTWLFLGVSIRSIPLCSNLGYLGRFKANWRRIWMHKIPRMSDLWEVGSLIGLGGGMVDSDVHDNWLVWLFLRSFSSPRYLWLVWVCRWQRSVSLLLTRKWTLVMMTQTRSFSGRSPEPSSENLMTCVKLSATVGNASISQIKNFFIECWT